MLLLHNVDHVDNPLTLHTWLTVLAGHKKAPVRYQRCVAVAEFPALELEVARGTERSHTAQQTIIQLARRTVEASVQMELQAQHSGMYRALQAIPFLPAVLFDVHGDLFATAFASARPLWRGLVFVLCTWLCLPEVAPPLTPPLEDGEHHDVVTKEPLSPRRSHGPVRVAKHHAPPVGPLLQPACLMVAPVSCASR